ncbi:iron-sulfur cluster assembly scaffold protein [Novosphingobium endophyticum]|uniref:Iron-sulfur cluster assembly scaffold protein n=1 Tax=Novosphingobium endophyticum TaxID=1955250 RepID=A0A916TRD4_9SPHN|nr:iron-sulfur cluster assembly scaffold protein [Novosphingobium endophyticum]GGB98153.1 iron-sulfur cluster assembly scaffold protein [Novosphingobium endophyticum]
MSATVLYTPDVLALAVELSRFPWKEDLPLRGEARSKSCGSTITLGLDIDERGVITDVAVRSQACAIGQAAAAIFAQAVIGMEASRVRAAGKAVADWLAGEEGLPDWPGLGRIAAARDYPGRHGAVILPWTAAIGVLPSS